eukprot:TRINITY_DN22484_c0_g1_i1.p1 TRINITY_DN22484_c0_g1~~TRINITY_DN22484_c0_g1_i1.p1  ORF type:complete len:336 (+),score=77.93 TRINITY_DN22484_c0_g1_i1:187-1194(+)
MPNVSNRPITLPPFVFKEKSKYIDWDVLSTADVEALKLTGDLSVIQNCGRELVLSQLHKSDLDKINDSNFIKLFKLSQLSIEYLLYVQEFLETVAKSADKEFNEVHKLCEQSESTAKQQRQSIVKLKKRVHIKEEQIRTCDFLIKEAGKFKRADVFPCSVCKNKYYSSQKALEGHYTRRHPSVDPCADEVLHEAKPITTKAEIPLKEIEEQVRNTMQQELVNFQRIFAVFDEKLSDSSRVQQLIANNRQHENTLMTKLHQMQAKINFLEQPATLPAKALEAPVSVPAEKSLTAKVKREPCLRSCTMDVLSFASQRSKTHVPVSYTHLTLPTICSV